MAYSDRFFNARRSFMLVLSRKQKERLKLGDSIVLTVLRIAGDRVRLGIEAPDEVQVLRDELCRPEDTGLGE
jgi:carbon storage regulator